jgi:hypothetical protein
VDRGGGRAGPPGTRIFVSQQIDQANGAVPDDRFTRIADRVDLPLLFVEGGWGSRSLLGSPSSPERQDE